MSAIPKITESEFQRQVTDLAVILGWQWAHFRPAQTVKGWRTPVSGPMGKGFPDLVLVHPSRGIVFAELKREKGKASAEQAIVGAMLTQAGATYRLWTPDDWRDIEQVLHA